MTLKHYTWIRMAVAMILAVIVSISIQRQNYLAPIISVILGILILQISRRRVKEVLADERDYEVAGMAARWAINIYSSLAVVAMFVLLAFKGRNPSYEVIAYVLAYSTCFLMLIYSLIAGWKQRQISTIAKRWIYGIAAVVLALMLLTLGLRLFSGEDDWICQNGQWVKHGNPSFPAPTSQCK